MKAPELQIRGLTKRFGKNTALSDVNLTFSPGEFIGLMGPNGAGKSTLIKILDGVYRPTEGELSIDGAVVASLSGHPQVAFIHQDLGLVDGLTIADNLQLGQNPMRRFGTVLDKNSERAHAARVLLEVGLHRDPKTMLSELSSGEKALIAVARALARGASVLFVDETTSTLPPAESGRVIDALTDLARRGATIVMVTHKLTEILDATNRVVVLLDGSLAADRPTEGLDRAALVSLLYRSEIETESSHGGCEAGDILLELRAAFTSRIGPVDLAIRSGQVVGVSGLPGSGLHDIGFLVHGSLTPTSGQVWKSNPAITAGLVPPHRESQGGFNDLSVRQNMAISSLRKRRSPMRLLSGSLERTVTATVATDLDVRPTSIDTRFGVLSGGNKQKAIFARALLMEPKIYVLCEPTRGVDVGTRALIYSQIRKVRDEGAGVLVVSSDAEDLFSVCDVVGIVADGRVGPLKAVADLAPAELEQMV
ncbi:ATP-binding cassette domain-containing protein [Rhodococcus erythropolis]|uniref:ATP-binding cassette domain-containing protein n=1 Tax=Rhodococcus erythropolis TaxID=1833 RepID=UPI002225E8CC|nr:sugar ABC transporter ATP-binding protein [Rhodococcus erythropolis]MCW2295420.1 ribose transport system ATP-binding protein [Rhodococcus erythropolis]